jgi:uncharacterized protein YacL (UPF0231 family)
MDQTFQRIMPGNRGPNICSMEHTAVGNTFQQLPGPDMALMDVSNHGKSMVIGEPTLNP